MTTKDQNENSLLKVIIFIFEDSWWYREISYAWHMVKNGKIVFKTKVS